MLRNLIGLSIFIFIVGCGKTEEQSLKLGDNVSRTIGKSTGNNFFNNKSGASTPGEIKGLWVLEKNSGNSKFANQAYYIRSNKTAFAVVCNNNGSPVYSYVEVKSEITGDTLNLEESKSYGARYTDSLTGDLMECRAELTKGQRYFEINGSFLAISYFRTQPTQEVYRKSRDNL